MARAGFWPIGGYTISFRPDGRWYADDEVIGNAKIARLFSRHVQYDAKDGWVIDLGIDRQPVVVVDTGLVVVSVEGDAREGLRVRTNDGESSLLDPATLEIGDENVLYCRVERGERGSFRARFLRPAYYELARWVEEAAEGPVIEVRGERHVIRGRS